MKKSFVVAVFVAVASIAFVASVHQVSAKRAKWYCYAPDPAMPWAQTCYSSTTRP